MCRKKKSPFQGRPTSCLPLMLSSSVPLPSTSRGLLLSWNLAESVTNSVGTIAAQRLGIQWWGAQFMALQNAFPQCKNQGTPWNSLYLSRGAMASRECYILPSSRPKLKAWHVSLPPSWMFIKSSGTKWMQCVHLWIALQFVPGLLQVPILTQTHDLHHQEGWAAGAWIATTCTFPPKVLN